MAWPMARAASGRQLQVRSPGGQNCVAPPRGVPDTSLYIREIPMNEPIERRKLITVGAAFAMIAASANQAAATDVAAYPTATGAWGPKVSVEDYVEIQQLYAHFCHAWDLGNSEDMANCWTEDGEMTRGFGPGQSAADR